MVVGRSVDERGTGVSPPSASVLVPDLVTVIKYSDKATSGTTGLFPLPIPGPAHDLPRRRKSKAAVALLQKIAMNACSCLSAIFLTL